MQCVLDLSGDDRKKRSDVIILKWSVRWVSEYSLTSLPTQYLFIYLVWKSSFQRRIRVQNASVYSAVFSCYHHCLLHRRKKTLTTYNTVCENIHWPTSYGTLLASVLLNAHWEDLALPVCHSNNHRTLSVVATIISVLSLLLTTTLFIDTLVYVVLFMFCADFGSVGWRRCFSTSATCDSLWTSNKKFRWTVVLLLVLFSPNSDSCHFCILIIKMRSLRIFYYLNNSYEMLRKTSFKRYFYEKSHDVTVIKFLLHLGYVGVPLFGTDTAVFIAKSVRSHTCNLTILWVAAQFSHKGHVTHSHFNWFTDSLIYCFLIGILI